MWIMQVMAEAKKTPPVNFADQPGTQPKTDSRVAPPAFPSSKHGQNSGVMTATILTLPTNNMHAVVNLDKNGNIAKKGKSTTISPFWNSEQLDKIVQAMNNGLPVELYTQCYFGPSDGVQKINWFKTGDVVSVSMLPGDYLRVEFKKPRDFITAKQFSALFNAAKRTDSEQKVYRAIGGKSGIWVQ